MTWEATDPCSPIGYGCLLRFREARDRAYVYFSRPANMCMRAVAGSQRNDVRDRTPQVIRGVEQTAVEL